MWRGTISLGLRIFVALVLIGVISQQIDYDTAAAAPGPKFVSPGDPKQDPEPGYYSFSELTAFAMDAARDMLGGQTGQPESTSSLQQLNNRNRTPTYLKP